MKPKNDIGDGQKLEKKGVSVIPRYVWVTLLIVFLASVAALLNIEPIFSGYLI